MITDWKGNEIKPGMEVCCILTKRKMRIHIPDNVPLGPYYEDCWDVGDFAIVELRDGQLGIFTGFRIVHDLAEPPSPRFVPFSSSFMRPFDDTLRLAIKGISDQNPNI